MVSRETKTTFFSYYVIRNRNNKHVKALSQEYNILLVCIINMYSMFLLCKCTEGGIWVIKQLSDLLLMHLINSYEQKKCTSDQILPSEDIQRLLNDQPQRHNELM